MLINLSNHPSTKWTPQQKEIALKNYESILDLPFPHIDPSLTLDQVRLLAEEYYLKIRKEAAQTNATVHVMGEMTFTHQLLLLLKENGIPAVASTTNRIVTEKDNKKIVQFEFVQFRPYF